jgi:hypothetical protein
MHLQAYMNLLWRSLRARLVKGHLSLEMIDSVTASGDIIRRLIPEHFADSASGTKIVSLMLQSPRMAAALDLAALTTVCRCGMLLLARSWLAGWIN